MDPYVREFMFGFLYGGLFGATIVLLMIVTICWSKRKREES